MPSHESPPTESDVLSDELLDTLDSLKRPTLRALDRYVTQELETLRPTTADQIETEADGKIVDIEDCGTYTLVRKQPPTEDDSADGSRPVQVYHVIQAKQPNGTDTLHWSFIGDMRGARWGERRRCSSGHPLQKRTKE